jgi:hypothetical protein
MRRDHLDAVLSQLRIQRSAVIGAIADQVFRLGFDMSAVPGLWTPTMDTLNPNARSAYMPEKY